MLDEDNTTVGFRSLRYEADTGFHMNEQHVKVPTPYHIDLRSLEAHKLVCQSVSQSARELT